MTDFSPQAVDAIHTREAFVSFVRSLAHDVRERPDTWENVDLPSFLEAAAAWAESMDGYYANRGERLPERPDWRTFALILAAARVYE
jgi:hypothetical protein